MPLLLRERQLSTKINATFGALEGCGDLMFCEKCQVEDQGWWQSNGANVAVIVQCTKAKQVFHYPPFAATSQKVRVDPRDANRALRQSELDQALPPIQAALVRGEDVVLLCMQAFHRAPVIGAAVCKRLTGEERLDARSVVD